MERIEKEIRRLRNECTRKLQDDGFLLAQPVCAELSRDLESYLPIVRESGLFYGGDLELGTFYT